jgi:hypothetical protein
LAIYPIPIALHIISQKPVFANKGILASNPHLDKAGIARFTNRVVVQVVPSLQPYLFTNPLYLTQVGVIQFHNFLRGSQVSGSGEGEALFALCVASPAFSRQWEEAPDTDIAV